MADRFFTPDPLELGDYRLRGADAHHLVNVRRFGVGDPVTLFNGDGREYAATIVEASKKDVLLHIVSVDAPAREATVALHIGAALPKGDRADFLVEKLTELGVAEFTPLITARSVVHPKPDSVEKTRRAVIEASKQCGRNSLMRVSPPARFADWLGSASASTRWILHPGDRSSEPAILENAAIAIGPEGGFTDAEIAEAECSGFKRLSLGPRVLRVETAALAIAAILLSRS
jgi:16S rRNA (uracil1498-N3)-methyltransferase